MTNFLRVKGSFTLKMEVVSFPETFIPVLQNGWCHIPGQSKRRVLTTAMKLSDLVEEFSV